MGKKKISNRLIECPSLSCNKKLEVPPILSKGYCIYCGTELDFDKLYWLDYYMKKGEKYFNDFKAKEARKAYEEALKYADLLEHDYDAIICKQFLANIAESTENFERALKLYQEMLSFELSRHRKNSKQIEWIEERIKKVRENYTKLDEKIKVSKMKSENSEEIYCNLCGQPLNDEKCNYCLEVFGDSIERNKFACMDCGLEGYQVPRYVWGTGQMPMAKSTPRLMGELFRCSKCRYMQKPGGHEKEMGWLSLAHNIAYDLYHEHWSRQDLNRVNLPPKFKDYCIKLSYNLKEE